VATNSISRELSRFIAQYIHSVEQLEILCLVSSNVDKSWTAGEVLHEIQSAEQSVSSCLTAFKNEGLLKVTPEGAFRFSAGSPGLVDLVKDLARTYRERHVTIIEMIYAKPSDPLQDVAEAFRFKKEK
jgi:hypothetical protein